MIKRANKSLLKGRTDKMAFELDPGLFDSDQGKGVTIRIVGVGGCGGNAVNNMIDRKISGVEYIVFNTDRQALLNSKAPLKGADWQESDERAGCRS